MTLKPRLLKRIDELIALGESSIVQGAGIMDINNIKYVQFGSEGHTFIETVYDKSHKLYKDFVYSSDRHQYYNLQTCLSILKAIKNNIEGDWIKGQRELLNAEIFEDFFEMAQHLIEENYKDAAAVIVGSILERHIKQVCEKNGIEIVAVKDGKHYAVKTDTLNTELYKKGIYGLSDQKQVVAWLGLRNDAAHGDYEKYKIDQVKLMLEGVRNFSTRIN